MKNIKIIFLVGLSMIALMLLTGCTEADKVNYNISMQANYFETMRRVTVYNARTDKVILEVEGNINISNNASSELVVTCKVGANEYKKNYVYLNEYTLYIVEDITGTVTDPYHYKVYLHYANQASFEFKP